MANADLLDLQRRIIAKVIASGYEFYGDVWADLDVRIGGGLVVGSLTTTPAAGSIIVEDATDPYLRLSEGGSTTSYTQFQDVSAGQSVWKKVVAAGSADLLIEPIASDGAGAAEIRLFRETNTAGLVALEVCKGDNTATYNHRLSGNADSYLCANNGTLGVGAAPSGTFKLEVTGDQAIQSGDLRVLNGVYIGDTASDPQEGRLYTKWTKTLAAGLGQGTIAGWLSQPSYTGAFLVTRHDYISVYTPTLAGGATLTDACVFYFNAAIATHKALDTGTTHPHVNQPEGWMKIDVNGATYYVPIYSHKT